MAQDICIGTRPVDRALKASTLFFIAMLLLLISALAIIGASGSVGTLQQDSGAAAPYVEDWHGNVRRSQSRR